jgi:hypothetical protein
MINGYVRKEGGIPSETGGSASGGRSMLSGAASNTSNL